MSEDQTTQAVVDETKGAAQPASAETSARTDDDLDTLLSQFDESKPKPAATPAQPEQPAAAAAATKEDAAEVLRARDEIRQDRFKRDMNDTIAQVRGDLPADFYDDTFMRAFIDAKAETDPRLGQAWLRRHEDPVKFKQVVNALGKEFAKKYGRIPDKAATEDREAVTAAVRGASTRAPEGKAPNYAAMTPNQLAQEWDKFT